MPASADVANEKVMVDCETQGLPYTYLLKLRRTPKVRTLVCEVMAQSARWQEAGDGWQAAEARLKLHGWSRTRHVVLVRESPARAPVGEAARRRRDPFALQGAQGEGWERGQSAPWSGRIAVLVTSLDEGVFPTVSMPRLYRERADAKNVYDELKNQWGWNGYTTRTLGPSRIMANLVALFYNWWNLYVRFFDEQMHREAITSRPALMQGVARQILSGGQRTTEVSLLHEWRENIAQAVELTSRPLHHMTRITERWSSEEKWALLLTRLWRRWLGGQMAAGAARRGQAAAIGVTALSLPFNDPLPSCVATRGSSPFASMRPPAIFLFRFMQRSAVAR